MEVELRTRDHAILIRNFYRYLLKGYTATKLILVKEFSDEGFQMEFFLHNHRVFTETHAQNTRHQFLFSGHNKLSKNEMTLEIIQAFHR